MTGEELGSFLGETIDALENASMTIDEVVSKLSDIDGKVIDMTDSAGKDTNGESRITVGDLNDLAQSASADLDSLLGEIEDIRDSLQLLNGNMLQGQSQESAD